MPSAAVEQKMKCCLTDVATILKPRGYRRSGTTFRKLADGNCAIVNFQRSRWSASGISFTVNLSIVCGQLLDPETEPLERALEYWGHLRTRLGNLLPERKDKWWQIEEGTDALALGREIVTAIDTLGLPYLDQYQSMPSLIALWRSGKGPGLTETQRTRYLAELGQ